MGPMHNTKNKLNSKKTSFLSQCEMHTKNFSLYEVVKCNIIGNRWYFGRPSHQPIKAEIVKEVATVIEDDQSLKLTNKNELSRSIANTSWYEHETMI